MYIPAAFTHTIINCYGCIYYVLHTYPLSIFFYTLIHVFLYFFFFSPMFTVIHIFLFCLMIMPRICMFRHFDTITTTFTCINALFCFTATFRILFETVYSTFHVHILLTFNKYLHVQHRTAFFFSFQLCGTFIWVPAKSR
jgi:hypothetical protein